VKQSLSEAKTFKGFSLRRDFRGVSPCQVSLGAVSRVAIYESELYGGRRRAGVLEVYHVRRTDKPLGLQLPFAAPSWCPLTRSGGSRVGSESARANEMLSRETSPPWRDLLRP